MTDRSLADMQEADFNWGDLKVQLDKFPMIIDFGNNVSFGKIIEIFSDRGKNCGQGLLIPEKLNFVKKSMLTIVATSKRSFS